MGVVRTGDVLHVHHIHREALQRVVCLENAAVADAATFTVAQPALGHALLAGGGEGVVWGAAGAMLALPLSIIGMTIADELRPSKRKTKPNLPG